MKLFNEIKITKITQKYMTRSSAPTHFLKLFEIQLKVFSLVCFHYLQRNSFKPLTKNNIFLRYTSTQLRWNLSNFEILKLNKFFWKFLICLSRFPLPLNLQNMRLISVNRKRKMRMRKKKAQTLTSE